MKHLLLHFELSVSVLSTYAQFDKVNELYWGNDYSDWTLAAGDMDNDGDMNVISHFVEFLMPINTF